MIDSYFAANPTSAFFLAAALICGLASVLAFAANLADERRTERTLAVIERGNTNRRLQMSWLWCCLVADDCLPTPTRRILLGEWREAAHGIERELSREEEFIEAARRG